MHQERSVDIGSGRELFVDNYMIGRQNGTCLRLHEPHPANRAFSFDQPWEGAFSGYAAIVKDVDRYRLYYRGWSDPSDQQKAVTCMAESPDGIHFERPELGLYDVCGTRRNNVILTCEEDTYTHNFAPMIDIRPGVPQEQRYKALTRNYGLAFRDQRNDPMGLFAFVSEDGIHWHKLRDEPVITEGKFDSLNVPFWSEHEDCYLCYLREVAGADGYGQGVRSIARCWSNDFVNWSSPRLMDMGDTPPEHLYTNATQPYFRAPHIYIALPGRFMPGRQVLSASEGQALGVYKNAKGRGFWNDCSDAVFMSSRGGLRYDRTFMEALVRPGRDRRNWTSRCNYPACGFVQTADDEMSIYIQRHNAQDDKHLERMMLRLDGFASLCAGYDGGEMVTKPFTFTGNALHINYATSAAGSVALELQHPDGTPMNGLTLQDCIEMTGDEIERTVHWEQGADVSSLAGQPVRLRFSLQDADIFSYRFYS